MSIQIDRCTTKRTWKEMDDWQTNKTEGEEVKTERDNKENEMKENKRKRGRARKREGLKTINAEDSYDESRIEPRLLFVALSSAGCPHSARARSGSAAGPPPFAGVRARALRKTITRGGWGGGENREGVMRWGVSTKMQFETELADIIMCWLCSFVRSFVYSFQLSSVLIQNCVTCSWIIEFLSSHPRTPKLNWLHAADWYQSGPSKSHFYQNFHKNVSDCRHVEDVTFFQM